MIESFLKLACAEAVAERISTELDAHVLLQAAEPAVERIIRPLPAVAVEEHDTGRTQQGLDDGLGLRGHVDDAGFLLGLGFFLREDDAMLLELDVPRFDLLDLLGPAAGLPGEFQQVAERITLFVFVTD